MLTFLTSNTQSESLAFIDAVFFLVVGFALAYHIRRQRLDALANGRPPVVLTGTEMRMTFVTCLAAANLSRAVSIIINVFVREEVKSLTLDESWKLWVREILMALPSLIFITSYSVVILFWAQVYYAAIMVSFPLLRPLFIFANIAAYGLFTVIALITLHMSAWQEVSQYMYLLLGTLYILSSIGLFIFGVRVAGHLSERRASSRSGIIRRVVLLTATCPLILLLRGCYSLSVGSGLISTSWPRVISRVAWDAGLYLISELLPSLLFIFMFWPSSEPVATDVFSSIFSSGPELASPLLKPEDRAEWAETESRLNAQLLHQNQ